MKVIVEDPRGDLETNVTWTKGLSEAGEVDLRALRSGSNYSIIIDLCGIDLRHRFDQSRDLAAAIGFAAQVTEIEIIDGETCVYCTLADPDEYPYLVEHLSKNLRLAA